MPAAFIIMQIGNTELDTVCAAAIVPALKNAGFDPKRVDKHNEGGLLKGEIIRFIQNSDIIVADLTNERPNCYLEIGYAMGVDKFRHLILTARQDHQPDRPGRERNDPKVHFDLAGYDILYWNPDDLDSFRVELEKRIRRRNAILKPPPSQAVPALAPVTWDESWIAENRKTGQAGLKTVGLDGYLDVAVTLISHRLQRNQLELLEAAKNSQIETFGWPMGLVIDRDKDRPRAIEDGIVAEIAIKDDPNLQRNTYDYWALRGNGDYYLLKSLFEDTRASKTFYFNTRIVRTTELLLFLARLYSRLGVPVETVFELKLIYGGLSGRTIRAAGGVRHISGIFKSTTDTISSSCRTTVSDVEKDLVRVVKRLLEPVFMVFDFFSLPDAVYADIVNKFVEGKVT